MHAKGRPAQTVAEEYNKQISQASFIFIVKLFAETVAIDHCLISSNFVISIEGKVATTRNVSRMNSEESLILIHSSIR